MIKNSAMAYTIKHTKLCRTDNVLIQAHIYFSDAANLILRAILHHNRDILVLSYRGLLITRQRQACLRYLLFLC